MSVLPCRERSYTRRDSFEVSNFNPGVTLWIEPYNDHIQDLQHVSSKVCLIQVLQHVSSNLNPFFDVTSVNCDFVDVHLKIGSLFSRPMRATCQLTRRICHHMSNTLDEFGEYRLS